jgi:hypothetical protein
VLLKLKEHYAQYMSVSSQRSTMSTGEKTTAFFNHSLRKLLCRTINWTVKDPQQSRVVHQQRQDVRRPRKGHQKRSSRFALYDRPFMWRQLATPFDNCRPTDSCPTLRGRLRHKLCLSNYLSDYFTAGDPSWRGIKIRKSLILP